jgi:hypothetical protein
VDSQRSTASDRISGSLYSLPSRSYGGSTVLRVGVHAAEDNTPNVDTNARSGRFTARTAASRQPTTG